MPSLYQLEIQGLGECSVEIVRDREGWFLYCSSIRIVLCMCLSLGFADNSCLGVGRIR